MSALSIRLLVIVSVSMLFTRAWAGDAAQFQFGMMYAEHIRGVGLYAGLETEGVMPNVSGYADATLLASNSYDQEEPVFGGVSVGVRSALPVPLSPYVGVGVYVGENKKLTRADHDQLDNDGNGVVDEYGEMKSDNTLMSAVYPEVGWRLALGSSFTMRMMGRYMVSSFGRPHDDWFYGISLAFGNE